MPYYVFYDKADGSFFRTFAGLHEAMTYAHNKATECLRKPIVKLLGRQFIK
jgi:hypothetical protein